MLGSYLSSSVFKMFPSCVKESHYSDQYLNSPHFFYYECFILEYSITGNAPLATHTCTEIFQGLKF